MIRQKLRHRTGQNTSLFRCDILSSDTSGEHNLRFHEKICKRLWVWSCRWKAASFVRELWYNVVWWHEGACVGLEFRRSGGAVMTEMMVTESSRQCCCATSLQEAPGEVHLLSNSCTFCSNFPEVVLLLLSSCFIWALKYVGFVLRNYAWATSTAHGHVHRSRILGFSRNVQRNQTVRAPESFSTADLKRIKWHPTQSWKQEFLATLKEAISKVFILSAVI